MPRNPSRSFNKCAHPECGAVVLKHTLCQRHRDRPPDKPITPDRQERKRQQARQRRARAAVLLGLPPGWAGVL
jgi:hypothetical protein